MNIAFKEHSIFYWIFYSNVANSESKPTLDRAQRYEQTRAKAVMICLYVATYNWPISNNIPGLKDEGLRK